MEVIDNLKQKREKKIFMAISHFRFNSIQFNCVQQRTSEAIFQLSFYQSHCNAKKLMFLNAMEIF